MRRFAVIANAFRDRVPGERHRHAAELTSGVGLLMPSAGEARIPAVGLL